MACNRWKCPECDTVYSVYEFTRLSREIDEEGYMHPVCARCGAVIKPGKRIAKDVFEVGVFEIRVSTVDLAMEHAWGFSYSECGYFYETLVEIKSKAFAIQDTMEIVARYKTREEALKGHKYIVEALKAGWGFRVEYKGEARIIVEWPPKKGGDEEGEEEGPATLNITGCKLDCSMWCGRYLRYHSEECFDVCYKECVEKYCGGEEKSVWADAGSKLTTKC